MSQKIVIAKEGYDASTETDPDNLTFSSDYGTLKYHLSGNTSIQIVGDDSSKEDTTEVSHNLGYVPVFIVYVNDFINDLGYNLTPFNYSTVADIIVAEAFADTSKLYLKFTNKSGEDHTVNFYYKIFRNNTGL